MRRAGPTDSATVSSCSFAMRVNVLIFRTIQYYLLGTPKTPSHSPI